MAYPDLTQVIRKINPLVLTTDKTVSRSSRIARGMDATCRICMHLLSSYTREGVSRATSNGYIRQSYH